MSDSKPLKYAQFNFDGGMPLRYAYHSFDGGMSLADINSLLHYLGYEIDSSGRFSELGPEGRFVDIIKVEPPKS